MKCGFSREEDEILTQILCKMKDKELQKELWRKSEEYNTLDKVLGAIRASEAAAENQMAAASQAASGSVSSGSNVSKRKCYSCDKPGHEAKNCPSRKDPNPKGQIFQLKCGFCGGPKRC